MQNADRQSTGAEPTSDRLSRLSAASLHIDESLDVDAALQAMTESVRSLTDAPYATIISLDDYGAVEDHLVLGFDPGDMSPMRTILSRLRRKLGHYANNPTTLDKSSTFTISFALLL